MNQPDRRPVFGGSRPETTLAAVTADANGTALNFGGACATWGMQVVLTGSPTGGTVTLQLSMDGTNWFATSCVFTIGTDANKAIKFLTNSPAPWARAVLAGLTGGTSPTVTATVAGE